MKRRRADTALPAELDRIADELRSGRGLREAIAVRDGSPLAHLAPALVSGRLAPTLRDAAAAAEDRDLNAALCVLAVHAEAGGDPIPAIAALADRLRGRAVARREARALTTQARLGARVILLLTPAFWLLLAASDPSGTLAAFADASTRGAIALGVALQLLGALWIAAIVGDVVPNAPSRWRRLPVVRAAWALVAGRGRDDVGIELAELAETLSFVLDAGLAPTQAIAVLAPSLRGSMGERLGHAGAVLAGGGRLDEALRRAFADVDHDAVGRLVEAFESSRSLGVPLAPKLRAMADDLRRCAEADLAEDVRRASVRVLAPLGVFILPAFVLGCLVPLLAGGLSQITG